MDSNELKNKKPTGNQNQVLTALNNISFKVTERDVLGIIGGNGAGKSTLQKVLSQITPPTKGKDIFRGWVSSLLEIRSGSLIGAKSKIFETDFHPFQSASPRYEKENVHSNGINVGKNVFVGMGTIILKGLLSVITQLLEQAAWSQYIYMPTLLLLETQPSS